MKMLRSAVAEILATVAMLCSSGTANAARVDYFGGRFDLSIADEGGGSYRVTYTADFTNFTNTKAQPYIDAIAWKHSVADVVTVSLLSAPGAGWVTSADSTINASGCTANGGNSWACTQDNAAPYLPTSGVLTWIFRATFSGGNLSSLDTTGDSIKARFVSAEGSKQGELLSCKLDASTDDNCSSTSVPEPTMLTIFGIGLLGLAVYSSKRIQRSH